MGSRQERLLELLDRFQEAEAQGNPVSVDLLCADCPDLLNELRRQVDLHRGLQALAGCGEPISLPDPGQARSQRAAAELPSIPGYELLRELGRGGMGVVLEARHLGLKRTVALKVVLGSDLAGREALARFRGEAETLACLHHPNVVQVFDSGEHDGRPFFAMELVRGGTLKDRLTGAPLSPARAAELVLALARAVQAAHAAGIVHRDLKPANVLLDRDGQGPAAPPEAAAAWGVPKVSDFGLAKRVGTGAEQTRTGAILGTPSYMAPEQAAGSAKDAGPLADVYALGAILYECLTGRPPFRGETPLDTIQQVLHLEPVPPRRLQPGVPRDLGVICLKCLEKAPGKRYASAAELAEDLQRFLDGEAIRARPPAAPERMWKWSRRNPAMAVASLAGAALLTVLVGLLWVRQMALDDKQKALDELRRAFEAAERAKATARRAQEEADAARYASDVRLADQRYRSGDVSGLAEILDRHVPPAGASEDRRGFEWWYLRQHAGRISQTLHPQSEPLVSLDYLPDGKSLVTVGGDNRLVVWDLVRRQERFTRNIRREGNEGLAVVSRNGDFVAWGGDHWESAYLWDVRAARERTPVRHPGRVACLGLSHDGRSLATCGDGQIAVWSTRTGKRRFLVKTPSALFAGVALAGSSLVVGLQGGKVDLHWYSLETGQLIDSAASGDQVRRLSLSPRGNFLLVVGSDYKCRVWDNKRQRQTFTEIRSAWLALSPDERLLAAAVGDAVEVYETSTRLRRATHRWQRSVVTSLSFSPDGLTLAAATKEGALYELDARANHAPDRLPFGGRYTLAIARLPDGKGFAVVTSEGEVESVDFRTGERRTLLKGCGKHASLLALSPDGQLIAVSWHYGRDAGIWDVRTGKLRTTLKSNSYIRAIAFAPDGRRLADCDLTSVRLWDLNGGVTASGTLYPPGGPVNELAFTPDGKTLLTAGGWSVCAWDVSGADTPHQPACTMRAGISTARLAVSGDGKTVATQESEGKVWLWKLSADRKLTPDGEPLPGGGHSGYRGLSFSRDGRFLLAIRDPDVDLWTLPGRSLVRLSGQRWFGTLSSDGKALALVTRAGEVEWWDTAALRVRYLGPRREPVRSLAFSPDGSALLVGRVPALQRIEQQGPVLRRQESAPLASLRAAVSCWNPATGLELPCGLPDTSTMALPSLVAWSARGLAAAGGSDGSIRVWNPDERRMLTRLFLDKAARPRVLFHESLRLLYPMTQPHYWESVENVSALRFSPDGHSLAVAGNRGSLRVWSTDGWNELLKQKHGKAAIEWLGFSPDSKQVAVSHEGEISFWDIRSKQCLVTVGDKQSAVVLCGALAPNGTLLATGRRDGAVRVWDLPNGQLRSLLIGHQDRVVTLAFSPDGKTLASGSWDGSVRLWSVAVGQEVAVLRGHNGKVNTLVFSPDGQTLATGSEDGEVLLWRSPRP
jgi:WD40 repeat protein